MENIKKTKADPKFNFLILQVTAALIAVAFGVCARAIGGDFYTNVKSWYEDNFGEETSIEQVLVESDQKINEAELLAELTASGEVNSMHLPLEGTVTSVYGYREHPIYGETLLHRGVDIGGQMGEDIACALDGEVIESGCGKSYGNYVIVRHSDTLTTLYAHCSKITVDAGDKVKKGDTVALVGSTGDSTGPHLHFEVCINGKPIDPQLLLEKI